MAARCLASRCTLKLMKRYLPVIIIVVVLVIAVGCVSFFWKRGGASSSDNNPTNPPSSSAGLAKPNVKLSSPIVIEEFGDYQCPPCGMIYPELKQIEHDYGDQVQIVFHHFPLTKLHKNAMVAAHAAEAARNQNKFWEMHDRLYRNQKEWADLDDPRPIFISYARDLKLNEAQFTADLDSPQVDARVNADIQRGTSLGVTGTPTIYIDTHLLRPEATNAEGLRRGINVMMERKAVS